MNVDEAIRTQRVIRDFSKQPIPDDAVTAILNAARRTGSSKNRQAWQFIVVRDRQRLSELAQVGDYAGHLEGAAVAIAQIAPESEGDWDLGRAAQNMTLVAWALGIGSAPATVYDHELCRSILGYPADQRCSYILSFGYPAEPDELHRPPKAGGRRPLAELVHQERWGAKTDGRGGT
jgi:nitroreductase